MLAFLADPDHEEYEQAAEWMDPDSTRRGRGRSHFGPRHLKRGWIVNEEERGRMGDYDRGPLASFRTKPEVVHRVPHETTPGARWRLGAREGRPLRLDRHRKPVLVLVGRCGGKEPTGGNLQPSSSWSLSIAWPMRRQRDSSGNTRIGRACETSGAVVSRLKSARLCALVYLLAASACDLPVADDPAPATTVRDSANIEIVENHAPEWDAGDFWTVEPAPEVVIGGYSGASEAADDPLMAHLSTNPPVLSPTGETVHDTSKAASGPGVGAPARLRRPATATRDANRIHLDDGTAGPVRGRHGWRCPTP